MDKGLLEHVRSGGRALRTPAAHAGAASPGHRRSARRRPDARPRAADRRHRRRGSGARARPARQPDRRASGAPAAAARRSRRRRSTTPWRSWTACFAGVAGRGRRMSFAIETRPTTAASRRRTGFRSASLHCGIKAKAGRARPGRAGRGRAGTAAGLFTTNLAKAAPVLVSQRHLETERRARPRRRGQQRLRQRLHGRRRPGQRRPDGDRNRGSALGCAPEEVLVASTGVIGVGLKMDRVVPGITGGGGGAWRGTRATRWPAPS